MDGAWGDGLSDLGNADMSFSHSLESRKSKMEVLGSGESCHLHMAERRKGNKSGGRLQKAE